jgi:hypothetical protein
MPRSPIAAFSFGASASDLPASCKFHYFPVPSLPFIMRGDHSSPRSGRMKIAQRLIGGISGGYEHGVREADG